MQPPLALSSSHKKVLLPPHINPMLTFILNTLDVIRKTSFNVNKINYRLKVSFFHAMKRPFERGSCQNSNYQSITLIILDPLLTSNLNVIGVYNCLLSTYVYLSFFFITKSNIQGLNLQIFTYLRYSCLHILIISSKLDRHWSESLTDCENYHTALFYTN